MFFGQEQIARGILWLHTLDWWAYPAFIAIYIAATLIGLPAVFMFLGAGSLFGFIPGLITVSISDTLSVAICYFLGQTLARKTIGKWIARKPQWRKLDRAVAKEGWKIVLLTRLSPIVPSNVLNYGFSLTKIDFWQYLFVSWLGMLPIIALYVYLASVGTNLVGGIDDPKQIAVSILGFSIAAFALAYTTRLMREALD
jgi:uncharacterized membrane protein YdjX (TVP38/TMEM64 family)